LLLRHLLFVTASPLLFGFLSLVIFLLPPLVIFLLPPLVVLLLPPLDENLLLLFTLRLSRHAFLFFRPQSIFNFSSATLARQASLARCLRL
jgi:hypothetical protein